MSERREQQPTPEELVIARAYHQELHRVDAWMEQAKQAWNEQHRTEERWQEDWRRYYAMGTTPYNPHDAGHREMREDWQERLAERRDGAVFDHFRRAGVVPEHVIARYFKDMRGFDPTNTFPETAPYPWRIAQDAAEEKAEQERERVNAEPRRVAYEQTIDQVTRGLETVAQRSDAAAQRLGLEQSRAERDHALVHHAVQAGVVSHTTGWRWDNARERGQHPQLADLAWMEAQDVSAIPYADNGSFPAQRQAVDQVIYAHQRLPQTPERDHAERGTRTDTREAPHQAPADRQEPTRQAAQEAERAVVREPQTARSPEQAARGWGQSWAEQEHEHGRQR